MFDKTVEALAGRDKALDGLEDGCFDDEQNTPGRIRFARRDGLALGSVRAAKVAVVEAPGDGIVTERRKRRCAIVRAWSRHVPAWVNPCHQSCRDTAGRRHRMALMGGRLRRGGALHHGGMVARQHPISRQRRG